jgi:hypothetical protein
MLPCCRTWVPSKFLRLGSLESLLTHLDRTTDSRHKMGMVVIANILNALKGEDLTNQVR